MSNSPKMVIFGLDCAAPELVLEKYSDILPNMTRLAAGGIATRLKSTDPPITVPSWTAMTTGRDPGELGLYGFRNRRDHSYADMEICNNSSVKHRRIWDVLADHDHRSLVIGVPQTFPPRIENGAMVAGFMTPSPELGFTDPPELKNQIFDLLGEYSLDVHNFRTMDKGTLLQEVIDMTEKRFTLLRHMIQREAWDFVMMVEIGLDRIHHAFWEQPLSPESAADKPAHQNAIRDYYLLLDREIGTTMNLLPDDTAVMVVSDHGAKPMKGGFCINDWLIREGCLSLKDSPAAARPLSNSMIDWSGTQAWGAGGYYARIFLNVEGREPEGTIPAGEFHNFRLELADRITAIAGKDGAPLRNRVLLPEREYRDVCGIPPDLLVYLDDLSMRSIGSVGHPSLWTRGNDEGVDLANHSMNGILLCNEFCGGLKQLQDPPQVMDVFHVVKASFGI